MEIGKNVFLPERSRDPGKEKEKTLGSRGGQKKHRTAGQGKKRSRKQSREERLGVKDIHVPQKKGGKRESPIGGERRHGNSYRALPRHLLKGESEKKIHPQEGGLSVSTLSFEYATRGKEKTRSKKKNREKGLVLAKVKSVRKSPKGKTQKANDSQSTGKFNHPRVPEKKRL